MLGVAYSAAHLTPVWNKEIVVDDEYWFNSLRVLQIKRKKIQKNSLLKNNLCF